VREIPEPWASAMVAQNLTDSRYADDQASIGRLAAEAGLHKTTVSRMIRGDVDSSPANVQAVADALHVDVVEVSRWVKQARSVTKPYDIPPEVHQLDEREQRALTELIRAMAAAKEREEHEPRSTPTTEPPPGRAAHVSEFAQRGLSPKEIEAALSEYPEAPAAPSPKKPPGKRRRAVG